MQPGGRGHADRRGGVPLVLAAAMCIDVGLAEHDGHRLGARRTEREELAVDALAHRGGDRGRAAAAHDEARRPVGDPGRWRGRRLGGEGEAVRGQRDRGRGDRAVDDERDVHRPVGAAVLAELAGAVERVDDPHPLAPRAARRRRRPLPRAPRRRDGRARARRRCSRATRRSPMAPAETRMCVPLVEQSPQLDEQLTGSGGDRGRAPMVRRRRRHQRRTLAAAECNGDRTTRAGVGGCCSRSRGVVGVRGDRPPDASQQYDG